jgi:tRNA modification GTPase
MTRLDAEDTIAAISSPPGAAARGIVRLSGPGALAIGLAGFEPDDGRPIPTPERPTWHVGRLRIPAVRPSLPARLALWPAPRTYTGQPLAELHTVGSPPVLRAVLADRLARGARLAEPGEFTLRAFLSGRIDLSRAEAVLGVIEARGERQLRAALAQLAGGLASAIRSLRDRLLDLLAHLEATLDFADEPDVAELARPVLLSGLESAAAEVRRLADGLRVRDRADERPRVVLIGPPNAGKSRLFNALLGAEAALVSPAAGTTRDYLAAPLDCDGLAVELIDTAGLEPGRDPIGARAQSLRDDVAATADLALACASADAPPAPAPPGALPVWTKADLAPAPPGFVSTSAATGAGLPELRTAIADALRARLRDSDAPAVAPLAFEALHRAAESLRTALETLRRDGDADLVAIDLRHALDDLGLIVGQVVTDDLLDRIFGRFCIGK